MELFTVPTSILLVAGTPTASSAAQPNPLLGMAPFFLMMVVLYFFVLQPQKKRQAEHQKMITAVKKGDKVVTSGGLIGVVVGVKEKTIIVRVSDNDTKIEFVKSAISVVNSSESET